MTPHRLQQSKSIGRDNTWNKDNGASNINIKNGQEGVEWVHLITQTKLHKEHDGGTVMLEECPGAEEQPKGGEQGDHGEHQRRFQHLQY